MEIYPDEVVELHSESTLTVPRTAFRPLLPDPIPGPPSETPCWARWFQLLSRGFNQQGGITGSREISWEGLPPCGQTATQQLPGGGTGLARQSFWEPVKAAGGGYTLRRLPEDGTLGLVSCGVFTPGREAG